MSVPIESSCQFGDRATIGAVEITLMSPAQVRALSVVEVSESAAYDKGRPRPYSVNDHRMGPVDHRIRCGTCGRRMDCPGHCGHIHLHYPVYHVGYIDIVLKVLKCVCFWCSALLLKEEDIAWYAASRPAKGEKAEGRLSEIVKATKREGKEKRRLECPHCGGPQPTYRRSRRNSLVIDTEWHGMDDELEDPEERSLAKRRFTAREALDILQNVNDEHLIAMGFNPTKSHPAWMVMTDMVVPPPSIRPTMTESEGSRTRGQEDLTRKLKDIVKANEKIAKFYMGNPVPDNLLMSVVRDLEEEGNEDILKLEGRWQLRNFSIGGPDSGAEVPPLDSSSSPSSSFRECEGDGVGDGEEAVPGSVGNRTGGAASRKRKRGKEALPRGTKSGGDPAGRGKRRKRDDDEDNGEEGDELEDDVHASGYRAEGGAAARRASRRGREEAKKDKQKKGKKGKKDRKGKKKKKKDEKECKRKDRERRKKAKQKGDGGTGEGRRKSGKGKDARSSRTHGGGSGNDSVGSDEGAARGIGRGGAVAVDRVDSDDEGCERWGMGDPETRAHGVQLVGPYGRAIRELMRRKNGEVGAMDTDSEADHGGRGIEDREDGPGPYDVVSFDEVEVPAKLTDELQMQCATLVCNDIKGQKISTQRTGTPTKGIKQRLSGKTGRIRGNLNGKRVNFGARAVITPDPNLDVNEIGVPYQIAVKLTYPEVVTPFNIDDLQRRVDNGPNVLYGAKAVIDHEGRMIHLGKGGMAVPRRANPKMICPAAAPLDPFLGIGSVDAGRHDPAAAVTTKVAASKTMGRIVLRYGWKVERHMKDGDAVIFNRQPSLHKGSMMGHRAVLTPCLTFGLNLGCTPSYNADFDGDEMNMHLPQTQEARSEVVGIMSVEKQIVSPQASKPVIGLVQDALLTAFLFTRRGVLLERGQAMDLLGQLKHRVPGREEMVARLPPPAIIKPRPMWTGKQLFSMLIPTEVNLVRKVRNLDAADPDDPEERYVVVQSGELICGSLCYQTVGTAGGGVIHIAYKDVGPTAASRFISDAQRMMNRWMSWNGFSVGARDCMAPTRVKRAINSVLDRAVDRIHEVTAIARGVDTERAAPRDEGPYERVGHAAYGVTGGGRGGRSVAPIEEERAPMDVDADAEPGVDDGMCGVAHRIGVSQEGGREHDREQMGKEKERTTQAEGRGEGGRRAAGRRDGSGGAKCGEGEGGRKRRKALRPVQRVDLGRLFSEKDLGMWSARTVDGAINAVIELVQGSMTVDSNHMYTMTVPKSKGSHFNIGQMLGTVGQQNNEGRPIRSACGSRTLSCYAHGELVPPLESTGLVRGSYERGLNVVEYYFALIGGREGLTDTAVKTADTGYIQRKLIKAMETHQAKHGGLIKNSIGDIIQFAYGGDGIDATHLERLPFPHLAMSDAEVRKDIWWDCLADGAGPKQWGGREGERGGGTGSAVKGSRAVGMWTTEDAAAIEEEVSSAIAARNEMRERRKRAMLSMTTKPDTTDQVPVNVPRIVERMWRRRERTNRATSGARNRAARGGPSHGMIRGSSGGLPPSSQAIAAMRDAVPHGAMTPRELCDEVTRLCESVDSLSDLAFGGKPGGVRMRDTSAVRALIRRELCSGRLIRARRDALGRPHRGWITREEWGWIARTVMHDYNRSLLQTGEMVGPLAAQSIGEPSTQMTLKTFHFAGCAAKNVTLGIYRLKEIIGNAPSMKSPSMTVYLKPGFRDTEQGCDAARRMLECVPLSSLVKSSKVVRYEAPLGPEDAVEAGGEALSAALFAALRGSDADRVDGASGTSSSASVTSGGTRSNWTMRYVLDRSACESRGIGPSDVARAIERHVGDRAEVWHTEACASQWTVNVLLDLPVLAGMVSKILDMVRHARKEEDEKAKANSKAKVSRRGRGGGGGTSDRDPRKRGQEEGESEGHRTGHGDREARDEREELDLDGQVEEEERGYGDGHRDEEACERGDTMMPDVHGDCETDGRDGSDASVAAETAPGIPWTTTVEQEAETLERAIVESLQARLLRQVVTSGVTGVARAHPARSHVHTFDEQDGSMVATEEWRLETEGTSLLNTLALPFVDQTRTHSNFINEIADVLGIEAAADVLHDEIRTVISFDGAYVNPRHFSVAVDTMTYRGRVLPMSRHGINKLGLGFLVRCSFEQTVDILFDAAAFAECNPIQDGAVTEAIITGQPAPLGTGVIDVLLTREHAMQWEEAAQRGGFDRPSTGGAVRGTGAAVPCLRTGASFAGLGIDDAGRFGGGHGGDGGGDYEWSGTPQSGRDEGDDGGCRWGNAPHGDDYHDIGDAAGRGGSAYDPIDRYEGWGEEDEEEEEQEGSKERTESMEWIRSDRRDCEGLGYANAGGYGCEGASGGRGPGWY